jgi:uroporphyrinogen III methyltransferase / synthase
MRGKVYLVGAGPGDPELITVKARRRLAEADVVLYDALVHPEALRECREDAELVFVGKRAGRESARQAAIQQLMLEHATAGKQVVRLKGGDPYLFGRGSEEAEFLHEHAIPFEVVPGVPSPLAATAYSGISLTHRERSSSVAYVTATESEEKDRSSHDWAKLATATQTLVIFMGVRKLESLMNLLVEHGRPASTPAAVIQWASLPSQRTVVGTVGDIAGKVREAGLAMPALTIVGEVVTLREHLRWYDASPLFGKRVLVPRTEEGSERLVRLLRDRGAEAIAVPTLRILPPLDAEPLARAAAHADHYDYVVFTSGNAVEAFWRALAAQGRDARALARAKVAAVGPKTAEALATRGVRADITATSSRAEGLLEALRAHEPQLAKKRILFPRAEIAREVLVEGLRAEGAEVDLVVAYRGAPPDEHGRFALNEALARGIDAVLVSSGATFEHLVDALAAPDRLADTKLVSIGPVTSATIRGRGFAVAREAREPSLESLVNALVEAYEGEP